MNKPTLLERAYQIADGGECKTVAALRKQLRKEGYDEAQLFGKSLLDDLGRRVKAARLGLDKPLQPKQRVKRQLLTADERSEAARRGAATRAAIRQGSSS